MSSKQELNIVSEEFKNSFLKQRNILSYDEYLDVFFQKPDLLMRNSAQYLKDVIEYFGIEETQSKQTSQKKKFRVFERTWSKHRPPIIGQSHAHQDLYRVVSQFVKQGYIDKVILLHGPNGSSKSSTAEALAQALEDYSQTDDGAIYRFSWIFPTDRLGHEGLDAASKSIGFGDSKHREKHATFAHLSEEETACKIISELKENPLFILPEREREDIIIKALQRKSSSVTKNEIPHHARFGAIGSKNKKIFDALVSVYNGDLRKVIQHVQVERFYFSSRYRTGIACIEPQVAVDIQEKQVTMDRNLQNLPPALQNIRFYEPVGELADANRGLVEFSDLLKRPIDAFKYLLTTTEKMSVNLQSGTADLDLIMLASANEKHLDAFKQTPDWPSFKGRIELIRVPYLLSSEEEAQIYQHDLGIIAKSKPIGPHAVELLSKWAVLTRLRQPDPENFDVEVRSQVAMIDPFVKLAIYDGDPLPDAAALKKIAPELHKEGQNSIAYEGRFGASPREMKMLLYFASQNPQHDSLSALSVFEELDKLILDRTVYDYLQFEARNGYHDYKEFIKYIKTIYFRRFNSDFLKSLHFFDETQYLKAFDKYLRHVISYLRKERIENEVTGKSEPADENFLGEIETLIGASGEKKEFREQILSKMASWRVENPQDSIDIKIIFEKEFLQISKKIYDDKEIEINQIKQAMLTYDSPDYAKTPEDVLKKAEATFNSLKNEFNYTRKTAWESLVFMKTFKPIY